MVVSAVLAKCGHPAAALDDAYIHFQYARAIVEGHPFRYQAGEPISTGATSFLWPALLAPFYALGLQAASLMWAAWLVAFAAHGMLAREVYLLAAPLAGRAAAVGAGAMTLVFGGLVWGAASGMEVVPFAFVSALGVRLASEWAEGLERARTKRRLATLFAVAVAAPMLRPEGALTALAMGAVVAVAPRGPGLRGRTPALAFVLAAALPNLMLLALTGSPTTSTAQVKLLVGNPYYDLGAAFAANARLLVMSVLDGGPWTAEFLPKGGAPVLSMGLVALVVRGAQTKLWVRAALVLAAALTMFVPCAYVTFLWNRLRYVWPFIPGWFVGVACLARVIAAYVPRVSPRVTEGLAGAMTAAVVVALGSKLDWVIEDVAQSASGIDRQQVALGKWVAETLPAGARVGLNDTGAIAYFGGRKTFDVVGLTTPTEGRYWVAGAGSRLEHYERVHATSPASLPSHFVVYPEWMACPPVLGRLLHAAVVRDATILGGQVMQAHEARWDTLGSGEAPWSAPGATVIDAIDVADLESEAAHAYALLGARDGEQVAEEGASTAGAAVVDGGRTQRTRDRFVARLEGASRGIARVGASTDDVTLLVKVAGREAGRLAVPAGGWTEVGFDVPAEMAAGGTSVVEVTAEPGTARFISYHYWFVAR